MSVQNKDTQDVSQEQQIKHALIDLLHNNEEVTHTALSKATGISLSGIQKHSGSIQSMLARLKKAHSTPNFKQ